MPVRDSGLEARLATLEAYVGTPKEPRGMTLTGRIEAQHELLVALSENVSDLGRRTTRLEERLDRVEVRLGRVEVRLDQIEGTLGVVLHGVTEIKNRLRPPADPDEGPSLNGSRIPLN